MLPAKHCNPTLCYNEKGFPNRDSSSSVSISSPRKQPIMGVQQEPGQNGVNLSNIIIGKTSRLHTPLRTHFLHAFYH
jgi:hypothetical protein